MSSIVFFDLETSGLDMDRHDITQIAAIAVAKLMFDRLGIVPLGQE